ncbi:suppressor of IKBKE 1 [Protopterus annectens]|uniref:suppressor of IKBKE 1 n=1 Tax=Protopterus annectens TaxID=7888 RepID=UPI001CFA9B27|nr:suppressor of IKBKE 1 [Protopterus annectens]
MTCTIDKILTDAKTLLERLKEHDNAADCLIEQSSTLRDRMETMKEVGSAVPEKEDVSYLKDMSKYKPHILLSQENTQIRDLQQENQDLWLSLEEHQYALELIMSKYRKQMMQLMMAKKKLHAETVLKVHRDHSEEIRSTVDRICEMGGVMRKAIHMDDEKSLQIQQKLAQLELENKELRELLSVSRESLKMKKEDVMNSSSHSTKPHHASVPACSSTSLLKEHK